MEGREQVRTEKERRGPASILSRLRPRRDRPGRARFLLRVVRGYNAKADLKEIQRAYALAKSSTPGRSVSGEDFIEHPLAVAHVLADLHLDTTTIVAALLHDTVEDTEVSIEQVERDWDQVARIVDGLTKLETIEFKSRNRPRTFAR